LLDATGRAAAGAISARVAGLTEGVLKTMLLAKIRTPAAIALAMSALIVGGIVAMTSSEAKETPNAPERLPPRTPALAPKDSIEVPSPRDGVLLVIGTEIKPGENVPAGDVVTVKVDGETKKYRRLRVGDKIEEGHVLARLDDRLARDDVAIAVAKFQGALAETRASETTRDEAKRRFESLTDSNRRVPGSVSQDEVQGAVLTMNRYFQEAVAKKQASIVAERQALSAKTILEMHEIRSPVKGVVKEIHKRRGEAVRALQTVVSIQIDENDK
jgi:multidrug efflux pump subunit AcrA (membrane-fusion protein)